MSGAIARRYARAVFELGRDEGRLGEVTRELAAFADAYRTSTELRELGAAPGVSDENRERIFGEIGSRLGASSITLRTVLMLARRHRLSLLSEIVRGLEELTDEHLGVLRVEVESAEPLSATYRERLKRRLEEVTGKRVLLEFSEERSLIAGVVTRIGDRVIDGSVRGRLDRLAESLRQT
jgi:F-type H+-transporting ATPase subunit delta